MQRGRELIVSGFVGIGLLYLFRRISTHERSLTLKKLHHGRGEVMGLRVELYHDAEKWTAMEAVARHMVKVHPQVPGWWIQWAFATRRAVSIESAMEILRDAENRSTQRTLHEHAP